MAAEWRYRRTTYYVYHKHIHDGYEGEKRLSGCLYVHAKEPTKWMLSTEYMGHKNAICIADQEEPPLEYAEALIRMLTGGE
jgi:hypothetical protein